MSTTGPGKGSGESTVEPSSSEEKMIFREVFMVSFLIAAERVYLWSGLSLFV
jgi:hypothetical protein